MSPSATGGTALATKLLAIINEMGPIRKGGFNSHFNYAFYREEDFIDAVRPLFVKHGVMMVPNVMRDTITPVTTGRGNTENLISVAVEYTLIDTESGDSLAVVGIGHGQDAGDKGLPKAMTGAMKAFLRQLFLISAGSADAEDDSGVSDAPPSVANRPQGQPQGQQARPQQQRSSQPPLPPGVDPQMLGFCPTHRKQFRLGNRGNRYCPTKIGENNGQAEWCNEGYEYDQQYGYVNQAQPSAGPQSQPQPSPRQEPVYDEGPAPMDVDDLPF